MTTLSRFSTPALALFHPKSPTVASADASSYGLGAVPLQQQAQGKLQPIAYISQSLTTTEQRYAQVEKDSLALTWACEHFSDYLIGLTFHIITDHKPLVPLFSTKSLDDLPICIQRFRMQMMRFNYTISHVLGKQLVIADMLSRAPTDIPSASDLHFEVATQAFVRMVLQTIPATEQRLAQSRELQSTDRVCAQVKQYCQTQWPNRILLSKEIIPYYLIRTELSIEDGLLLRAVV